MFFALKKIIGRTDIADFPALGLKSVPVKIDTGAYTSSMHCIYARAENGVLKCRFFDQTEPETHFTTYKKAIVRSSNGYVEQRYKIKTTIALFNKVYKIDLTLTSREKMKFPVLIGRQFLNKKFMVNPSVTNLSFKHKDT